MLNKMQDRVVFYSLEYFQCVLLGLWTFNGTKNGRERIWIPLMPVVFAHHKAWNSCLCLCGTDTSFKHRQYFILRLRKNGQVASYLLSINFSVYPIVEKRESFFRNFFTSHIAKLKVAINVNIFCCLTNVAFAHLDIIPFNTIAFNYTFVQAIDVQAKHKQTVWEWWCSLTIEAKLSSLNNKTDQMSSLIYLIICQWNLHKDFSLHKCF
jgi:hypothetical protein